jgi:hypothetical protein
MGLMSETKRRRTKWLLAMMLVLVAAMLMTGCQASDSDSAKNAGGSGGMADSLEVPANVESEESGSIANTNTSNQAASGEKSIVSSGGTVTGGGAGASGMGSAANGEPFSGKIIYTAKMALRVEDIAKAGTELRDIIHASGAYILQFNDSRYDGEIASLYTIKVPAGGFMSFVDKMAEIPNVKFQQDISGKDVSEEYVDLESRLKARRLVEERLLGMMEKADKADDLLKFSNQLAEVQEQIEQLLGRIRYLDANVAYSTVELRIYQVDQKMATGLESDSQSFGARLSGALTGSSKAVWAGIQGLMVILAGALPVLAILAVIGIPVFWFAKHRRKGINSRSGMPQEKNAPPES